MRGRYERSKTRPLRNLVRHHGCTGVDRRTDHEAREHRRAAVLDRADRLAVSTRRVDEGLQRRRRVLRLGAAHHLIGPLRVGARAGRGGPRACVLRPGFLPDAIRPCGVYRERRADRRQRRSATRSLRRATLHVRLPVNLRLKAVNPTSGANVAPDGESLPWNEPRGSVHFTATIGS